MPGPLAKHIHIQPQRAGLTNERAGYAPVSIQPHWDEVKPGLHASDFTLKNALARIREIRALFVGVLGHRIQLPDHLW